MPAGASGRLEEDLALGVSKLDAGRASSTRPIAFQPRVPARLLSSELRPPIGEPSVTIPRTAPVHRPTFSTPTSYVADVDAVLEALKKATR